MSAETLVLVIFIVLIGLLLFGIVYAIRSKNTTHSGSFASMAAFHDFQAKDKQNAMETVIEKQAQKKWEEDESGEDKK